MYSLEQYKTSILLVFFAGVLWSTIGLGVRLIHEAHVLQILLYRSCSLSIFLFIFIIVFQKQNPFKIILNNFWPNVIGGLGLFLAYSGGIYAIQKTSVANAMFIFACAPLITAILAKIVLGESVKKITLVCILIAFIGISIMIFDNSLKFSATIGNVAAIFSAFGFSIFTVCLRYGKEGNMMPAVMFSGILAILITFLLCFALKFSLSLSKNDMFISLGMGVFQVGAGLVLYTLGSKVISAAELTLLSLSEVMIGPIWVWIFLNESISLNTFIGGSILFLAIILNVYLSSQNKLFGFTKNNI